MTPLAAPLRLCLLPLPALLLALTLTAPAPAQPAPPAEPPLESPQAPGRVDVRGVSADAAIADRLARILESTGWFEQVRVEVREGVVFLDGRTLRREYREWAGDLARNTQDVVAVVNRVRLVERPLWDFTPAWGELRRLWRGTVESLPLLVFGAAVLVLSWLAARLAATLTRRLLAERLKPLLLDVAARAVAVPVFIFGAYLVLRVAGLTRLAVTLLGGTGLVGLVIGIAFRDILENFLAGVLISLRNPFRTGDLVEIAGHLGVVQKVTTRGTILMDHDGNHVQIPNATVYKSIILNYTANPNRRMNFEVGIGYENFIPEVQETALAVLREHPAVLAEPEPLVLVEKLGPATVNLRVYFWLDGTRYEAIKVRSSLIRLVKRAFQERGISMPDEAREVVFPAGVTVRLRREEEPAAAPAAEAPAAETAPLATAAEGDLRSTGEEIREQARRARVPEEGGDLLRGERGPKAGRA